MQRCLHEVFAARGPVPRFKAGRGRPPIEGAAGRGQGAAGAVVEAGSGTAAANRSRCGCIAVPGGRPKAGINREISSNRINVKNVCSLLILGTQAATRASSCTERQTSALHPRIITSL